MPDHTHDGAAAEWEAQYAGADRLWSGRVNAALVDAVSGLAPGRSLDVGCGEGADVHWLASHGWDAEGIDLSAAAIARATAVGSATAGGGTPAAGSGPGAGGGAGSGRARFHVADILTWAAEHPYDLVSVFFLHTTDDRGAALRAAAALVAPGGRLLVVSHASMPPWARHAHPEYAHGDLAPEVERTALGLDDNWGEVEIARIAERPATGPGGERATLRDSVLMIRRR